MIVRGVPKSVFAPARSPPSPFGVAALPSGRALWAGPPSSVLPRSLLARRLDSHRPAPSRPPTGSPICLVFERFPTFDHLLPPSTPPSPQPLRLEHVPHSKNSQEIRSVPPLPVAAVSLSESRSPCWIFLYAQCFGRLSELSFVC